MAVEAPHFHLIRHLFNTNQDMDSEILLTGTMFSPAPALLPFYQPPYFNPLSDFTPKADSGLTYNPRKRPRDSIQKSPVSFLDADFTPQIHHFHQSEISDYVQKVETELGERRSKQSRMIIASIQHQITKEIHQKDDEINRIRKLNWFLEERVKNLCVENQIWRDLAQTNEATANSLRNNLEQLLLAHVSQDTGGGEEDAESTCGGAGESNGNKCKRCGEREESVVVMPCRHLCLCTLCGSSLFGTCPTCHSPITGSVHINLS
ncbi:SBP (S-ribonuclease binding protein) family protein [Euphorbia peplus]|nr:SBP (S-ribonuclease binding protein) family protein [Euphorbia peplus]